MNFFLHFFFFKSRIELPTWARSPAPDRHGGRIDRVQLPDQIAGITPRPLRRPMAERGNTPYSQSISIINQHTTTLYSRCREHDNAHTKLVK